MKQSNINKTLLQSKITSTPLNQPTMFEYRQHLDFKYRTARYINKFSCRNITLAKLIVTRNDEMNFDFVKQIIVL